MVPVEQQNQPLVRVPYSEIAALNMGIVDLHLITVALGAKIGLEPVALDCRSSVLS